jgi:hypothetical protein
MKFETSAFGHRYIDDAGAKSSHAQRSLSRTLEKQYRVDREGHGGVAENENPSYEPMTEPAALVWCRCF